MLLNRQFVEVLQIAPTARFAYTTRRLFRLFTCRKILFVDRLAVELLTKSQQHLAQFQRRAQTISALAIVPTLEAIHLNLQTKIFEVEFIRLFL